MKKRSNRSYRKNDANKNAHFRDCASRSVLIATRKKTIKEAKKEA